MPGSGAAVRARRIAALAWTICVIMAVLSAVFMALGPGRSVPGDIFGGVSGLSFLVLSLAFATVGAIVASRVPENRIGWVFGVTGLVGAANILAYQYASYGLHATPEPLAGATAAAWSPVGLALPGLFGLSLLLFPEGRLTSRRWLPAAAMPLMSIALLMISYSLRPGPLDDPFATVSNPLGVAGAGGAMGAGANVGWVLAMAGLALGAASMLIRLRRASGVERQQLKLVLAVAAVVGAAAALTMLSWFVWPDGRLQTRMAVIGLSFAGFPVAAGVAIRRYRLYDIDVIVNRTLVYGALTATLVGAYLTCVLVLQIALSPLTAQSDLAIAGSTLAVAALFGPARRRIQALVDRRFYRRRYDATRTLEGFSTRLRDEVDLEALGADLRGVVREAVQPAHVSLWLRGPGARR